MRTLPMQIVRIPHCLDYGNIAANLPGQIKNESTQSEDQVAKQLYKEYAAFKRALFADLTKRNPQRDQLTLFKKSQKLLDRILFILSVQDFCQTLPLGVAVVSGGGKHAQQIMDEIVRFVESNAEWGTFKR